MKKLLNINEAAEYVGLHPQTIRTRIHEGTFPYVKTSEGKNFEYRFNVDDLDKWIDNLSGLKAADIKAN